MPIWLRYLWAGPNTLMGLLVVLVARMSGGKVQRHSGVVEACGGVPAWCMKRLSLLPHGIAAITFGHVVIGQQPADLEATRVHERVHVEQYGRWGPFFLPAYGLSSLFALLSGKDPYRDNPFEREAYRIEYEYRIAQQRRTSQQDKA